MKDAHCLDLPVYERRSLLRPTRLWKTLIAQTYPFMKDAHCSDLPVYERRSLLALPLTSSSADAIGRPACPAERHHTVRWRHRIAAVEKYAGREWSWCCCSWSSSEAQASVCWCRGRSGPAVPLWHTADTGNISTSWGLPWRTVRVVLYLCRKSHQLRPNGLEPDV